MPLFDADNRLSADECAVCLREAENDDVAAYRLAYLRGDKEHMKEFVASNRNLRSWDGYGLDRRVVDDDSRLRLDGEVTNPRSRVQLAQRVFHAVPDLSSGTACPELELLILEGAQTTRKLRVVDGKSAGDVATVCDRLAEKQWDRFHPAMQQVGVEHIVPPWTNGGAPSRDIARSPQFLNALGYTYNGRVWSHK